MEWATNVCVFLAHLSMAIKGKDSLESLYPSFDEAMMTFDFQNRPSHPAPTLQPQSVALDYPIQTVKTMNDEVWRECL